MMSLVLTLAAYALFVWWLLTCVCIAVAGWSWAEVYENERKWYEDMERWCNGGATDRREE